MEHNTLLSKLPVEAMVAEAKKLHEELKREVEAATSSAQLEEIRSMAESGLDEIRSKLRDALLPPQFWGYLDYLIRQNRRVERRNLKKAARDQR